MEQNEQQSILGVSLRYIEEAISRPPKHKLKAKEPNTAKNNEAYQKFIDFCLNGFRSLTTGFFVGLGTILANLIIYKEINWKSRT